MNYNQFYLTVDGLDLLNRTTTGERLTFTRIGLGTGVVNSIQEMRKQKDLIDARMSIAINEIENKENGTCVVKSAYNNREIETGFIVREMGLYAQDPIKGEILYFIANAGDEADFLPPYTTNLVEMQLHIIVVVGDASEITISIDDSMIYVTKDAFDDLAGKGRTGETVKKNADDILRMQLELAAFKGSTINGMGENSFYVVFDEFAEDEEYEGVWDKSKSRLGIYGTGGEV